VATLQLESADFVRAALDLPSRSAAWRVMRQGQVPGVVRIGRRLRVRVDVLEKWVADGCPPVEPQPDAQRAR
jgi:hypothetical protein